MPDDLVLIIEKEMAVKVISTEKLFSRRNKVYLVQTRTATNQTVKYAVKVYRRSGAAPEASLLRELKNHGVRVPRVEWNNSQIIVMEYVEGMLLVDLTSSTEFISQPLWIKSLAGWLHRLHSVNPLDGKVLCFPDCNLRNLIYADGEITGVDFEETVYDWPERDIGGICAFILNSDPMFTGAKYRAVQQLAASYASLQSINMKRLQEYCLYELEQAAQRRPGQHDILLAKINELQDGKIFG